MAAGISVSMLRFGSKETAVEAVDPDLRLLERCKQGDRHAFEELFRKHQTYVYNVSLGILSNSEDAADVTQETFLRLHRNLDSFRGDSTFSTWLYRVAVNLSITELRKKNRSKYQYLDDVLRDEESPLHEEQAPGPEEAFQEAENGRVVQRVLKTLPEDYRIIMVLRHFQQLAYEEIADVLSLSLSQVKTRLFRARKMFKERFEAFADERHAL